LKSIFPLKLLHRETLVVSIVSSTARANIAWLKIFIYLNLIPPINFGVLKHSQDFQCIFLFPSFKPPPMIGYRHFHMTTYVVWKLEATHNVCGDGLHNRFKHYFFPSSRHRPMIPPLHPFSHAFRNEIKITSFLLAHIDWHPKIIRVG
jgi:hypothetical protein